MSLTLHIAEGEKCASALWEVGLIATTSQGGAGRPNETDWAPAAQFSRVVIWQDVDRLDAKTGKNPGVTFAEHVAWLIREADRGQVNGGDVRTVRGISSDGFRAAGTHEGAGLPSQNISSDSAGTNPLRGASSEAPEIIIVELQRYWGGSLEENYGRDVFDLIAEFRDDGKANEEIAAGLNAIAEQYHRAPGIVDMLRVCVARKSLEDSFRKLEGFEAWCKEQIQNEKRSAQTTRTETGRVHTHAPNSQQSVDGTGCAGGNAAVGADSNGASGDARQNSGNPHRERRDLGHGGAANAILMPTDFQPKPLGSDPVGRQGRKGLELRNWDGQEGLTVDEIHYRLMEITNGWPARVRSPGAKHPLLFVDYGTERMPDNLPKSASLEKFKDLFKTNSKFSELMPGPIVPDRIRWIGSGEQFRCWTLERTRPSFRPKMDAGGNDHVSINDLYQYCGNSRGLEYKAVECRPHWPPLPGHYYAWEHGGKYVPDGSALRGLLEFFSNCKDPISMCVALAAIMTPAWGAPYGKKPMVVFQAPDRGCGKTTLAECISKIWNGHLSIDLSGRDQDELVQRLLTPEALTKRIGILDNVKGVLSSVTLEWLVTTALISGKRLYSGDASRPNTINYFITMNGPSCSPDVALRSYFVELQKPVYSPQWDERLAEYVAERGCDVVADVGRLLCAPVCKPPTVVDRWPLWGREVLSRAADFIGVDVDAVMRRTMELRNDCDDEQDECNELMAGLLRLVSGAEGVSGGGDKAYRHSRSLVHSDYDSYRQETTTKVGEAKGPIFVSSTEMIELWRAVLGGKLRPRQIWKVLAGYLGAGKLPDLSRRETSAANGYDISMEAMNKFLKAYRESLGIKEVASVQTPVQAAMF